MATRYQPLPTDIILCIISYLDTHETYWNEETENYCEICEVWNARFGNEDSGEADPRYWQEHSSCHGVCRIGLYRGHMQTLSRLACVSKTMNNLVTPTLYKKIRLFGHDIKPYVRTMAFNDRLRKFVRKLSLDFRIERSFSENSTSDLNVGNLSPYYNQWSQTSSIKAVVGDEQSKENDGIEGRTVFRKLRTREDALNFLMHKLDNLEYLRFKFSKDRYGIDSDYPSFLRYTKLYEAMALPHQDSSCHKFPAAIMNLREFVICNSFEEYDTMRPDVQRKLFLDVEDVEPFWYSPKLESLTLYRIQSDALQHYLSEPMSSVKHLRILDSAIHSFDFGVILSAFKGLRSICYSAANVGIIAKARISLVKEMIDPELLIETFARHRSTLEELELMGLQSHDDWSQLVEQSRSIDWRNAGINIQEEEDEEEDRIFQTTDELDVRGNAVIDNEWLFTRKKMNKLCGTIDLRPFQVLKKATFHITDFIGWTPDWSIGRPGKAPRLSRVLPSSIEELNLKYSNLTTSCLSPHGETYGIGLTAFDHLRDLIEDAGNHFYDSDEEHDLEIVPNLRNIRLLLLSKLRPDIVRQLEALEKSAAEKGIRLTSLHECFVD